MLEITSQNEFDLFVNEKPNGDIIEGIFFNFELELEKEFSFKNCVFVYVIPARTGCIFTHCVIDTIVFDSESYSTVVTFCTIKDMLMWECSLLSYNSTIAENRIESIHLIRSDIHWANFCDNIVDTFTVHMWSPLILPPDANNNFITLGIDNRGYTYLLKIDKTGQKAPEIHAGCRKFTIEQAIEHWSGRHNNDPFLKSQINFFVQSAQFIIAELNKNAHTEVN